MAIDDAAPRPEGAEGTGRRALDGEVFRRPAPTPGEGCPFHRWREDFPIGWEADHYVTRRELTKFLTLGSALLVGANVVIAALGQVPEKTVW